MLTTRIVTGAIIHLLGGGVAALVKVKFVLVGADGKPTQAWDTTDKMPVVGSFEVTTGIDGLMPDIALPPNDRLDRVTQYLCYADTPGFRPFFGSVSSGAGALPWADFMAAGAPLTPAEISALQMHIADTANPHQVTRAQVGLGNVDNTADVEKPLSTAALSYVRSLLKRSYTGIRSPVMTVASVANNAAGDTYETVMELDSPRGFDSIRILIPNHHTSGVYTVGPFIAAAGNSISIPNSPSEAWTPVTFNGGASTVTVPNCTDVKNPQYVWSDWINLSSVDRTDIPGALPLIFLRGFIPGATPDMSVISLGTSGATYWPTRATRKWLSRLQTAVNGVTTPGNFTQTTNTNHSLFAAVQFSSRGRTVTVQAFGDSITLGSGASARGESFQMLAAEAASSAAQPVEYINSGWAGQTVVEIAARAVRLIPLTKPDIAIFHAFTPDGIPTATVIKNDRIALAAFMRACEDNLVLPIVLNGLPDPGAGWTAGQDAYRTAFNAELLTYPGVIVVDIATPAGDGASPEGFTAGWSDDGTHPNDTGNAALGAVLLPYIQAVL